MAHGQPAGHDEILHSLGQVEQAHQVCNMAARFADESGERLLAMAELIDQALIGLRFLNGIEILALDILDQGDFQRLGLAEVADNGRNAMELRLLGRAPASLSGDDLEAYRFRPAARRSAE